MKLIAKLLLVAVFAFAGCERVETKKSYFPSGKQKEEWEVTKDEYDKDIKNGLYRAWYENGQLHHEIHYLDDKKHGLQKSYFENGKLELEENYLFGKLNGKRKHFTIEGKLEQEVDFVDGKQHGMFIRLRPSGLVHHKITYKDGVKHGSHEIYDTKGNLETITCFDEGKISECPPDSSIASAGKPSVGKPDSADKTAAGQSGKPVEKSVPTDADKKE